MSKDFSNSKKRNLSLRREQQHKFKKLLDIKSLVLLKNNHHIHLILKKSAGFCQFYTFLPKLSLYRHLVGKSERKGSHLDSRRLQIDFHTCFELEKSLNNHIQSHKYKILEFIIEQSNQNYRYKNRSYPCLVTIR